MLYRNSTAPTAANDISGGYAPGDLWINTATGLLYRCMANGEATAVWSPAAMQGIRDSGLVVLQGETVVGSGTVPLLNATTFPFVPCARVWLGAPTSNHTKGSANTGNILVGCKTAAGNASGGIPLAPSNYTGFYYPVSNAADIQLYGFNAGDAVEYQVFV